VELEVDACSASRPQATGGVMPSLRRATTLFNLGFTLSHRFAAAVANRLDLSEAAPL